jgi:hypothetical protein
MVAAMKKKFFAALAGAAIAVTGCIQTVSDTSTFAVSPVARDSVSGRYQRDLNTVYQASKTVLERNGVLLTEYIPHDYTNETRSLQGRVNDRKVWIRVQAIDPKVSQVDVQARTKGGRVDLDLVHELEKEVALELAH